MPSMIVKCPPRVLHEAKQLDEDFEEGYLTRKGFYHKKWILLRPFAPFYFVRDAECLKSQLIKKEIPEEEYYNKLHDILAYVIDCHSLETSENETYGGTLSPADSYDSPVSFNSSPVPGPSAETFKPPTRKSSRKSCEPSRYIPQDPNGNDGHFSEARAHKNVSLIDLLKGNVTLEGKIYRRKSDNSSDEGRKVEESTFKKIKLDVKQKKTKKSTRSVSKIPNGAHRCPICHQHLGSIRMYEGHPESAVEEYVALTDSRLSLFTGEEYFIDDYDAHPQNKITCYSVYDEEGHLCPFDTGLIEENALLYFSGYLKPVYAEDRSIEGGIPTKDMGPINEWWISGFDGGDTLLGFSTSFGEYFLMDPNPDYAPLLNNMLEKIYIGKTVVEFLLDEENPSFEDLLNKLATSPIAPGAPKITEDSIFEHAQFICDQVLNYEAAADAKDRSLITTPCMRFLIKVSGAKFGKRQPIKTPVSKALKMKKQTWSKATTTPLVSFVFETFFADQLDRNIQSTNRKSCGVCESCQLPDCGTCANCADMVKFGGYGITKLGCARRRCPSMAVQEAEDSDPEDEDIYQKAAEEMSQIQTRSKTARTSGGLKVVEWSGPPILDDKRRVFYRQAVVDEEKISIGDYVSVESVNPTSPQVIGKVVYMWENKQNQKFMHAHWFMRGSETVLGETADPQELFLVDECENSLLSGIRSKVIVVRKFHGNDWNTEGGEPFNDLSKPIDPENDKMFFYQKCYIEEYGRFEDPREEPICQNPNIAHRFCPSCERLYRKNKFENPYVEGKIEDSNSTNEVRYEVVKWRGEEYRAGCCVFLHPNTFKFETNIFKALSKVEEKEVDEDFFPEFYRKNSDSVKGSNLTTPNPFCIGLIVDIWTDSNDSHDAPSDITLRVLKFYRPENTIGINSEIIQVDLNKLYASNEEAIVNFGDVTGKCTVVYSANMNEDIFGWSHRGPLRFYFDEAYDPKTQQLVDPVKPFKMLGNAGKGKGKGKRKVERKKMEISNWPAIRRPLRCFDIFAGCGGLTEGLHQSGVAVTEWAVESDDAASQAFRLNYPSSTVFNEDCNLLLKLVMNGEEMSDCNQLLPQKGDVELLCGGPPCQGFSGMNRFNSRQYSLFKNSLIVSYLSFCDYYRPRFFILENVRNFVSFKRSMVLKLTIRCLITMGYQVAFGIVQAGNYGVPQTRRRAIILAAAPGEKLPNFPEPQHVFNLKGPQLSVQVDDKKFISTCQWLDSAPYRTMTVRDAMSDLPPIPNGWKNCEMSYSSEPLSHFQRMMRYDVPDGVLRDHICKDMAPLVETRISLIPKTPGSDWRDLPNAEVILDSGSINKLVYSHHSTKNGKSKTGSLRGVCSCASGKPCDPNDRQVNTLIPWCLPHTANRHNNWAGLYGRLDWDGFFSTTVTNPEPMGKQGRVLHPEQSRVVSVRECARSQGFPDRFRFVGSLLEKHRQVGNAVPPPLGACIGHEILKCISQKENDSQKGSQMETN